MAIIVEKKDVARCSVRKTEDRKEETKEEKKEKVSRAHDTCAETSDTVRTIAGMEKEGAKAEHTRWNGEKEQRRMGRKRTTHNV